MALGRRTQAKVDRIRRRQYVSDARIIDIARKTALSGPCKPVKGNLHGCFTAGWQHHVELGPGVEKAIRASRSFAAHVRELFKEHARTMPHYLLLGYEHQTQRRYAYRGGHLWMLTHCTDGGPDWDINRIDIGDQCHLYTAILLP